MGSELEGSGLAGALTGMAGLLEKSGFVAANGVRRFQFERDRFAFANELAWEYRLDEATGTMSTFRNDPPPSYVLRCFVLVRSARQFLYHARFAEELPVADAATYRRLIRAVVSRNSRRPSDERAKIEIPGYDCLSSFSRGQEALLKAECGGAWQSYCLRSHWRMIFPMWRGHQERMARQVVEAFEKRSAPIVHLVRFPQLTINHGILLYDLVESAAEIRFLAYDPNQPGQATELIYHRAERTFTFPRNAYWAGGRVDVMETYSGWFY